MMRAYPLDGCAGLRGTGSVRRGELAVLGDGASVSLKMGGEAGRLILVAGKPLHEPVAKYGPFVMNTPQQIREAIADFNEGRF